MGLNRWRDVHYTDDGCNIYQCLACGHSWESRDAPGYQNRHMDCSPDTPGVMSYSQNDKTVYYCERPEPVYVAHWSYCPVCGVKWAGEHICRSHNMPRWEYERYGSEGRPHEVDKRQYALLLEQEKQAPAWVVEWRDIDPQSPDLSWHTERVLRGEDCTSVNAKKWLRIFRQESLDAHGPGAYRYRVRRLSQEEKNSVKYRFFK